MGNILLGIYEMWNTLILVNKNHLQTANLFIFLLLLFIFDKATDQTFEYFALISFEACEEYSSPGTQVVFKSKIQRTL